MKYAVLLRGVNIGGKTVKSDELKNCFSSAGFKSPQTILATGNILVESPKSTTILKSEIEQFMQAYFQFPIMVLVIAIDELKEVVANYSFKDIGEEYHRYVIFKDTETVPPNIALDGKTENVQPVKNVIYWYVLKGHTLDSDFAKHMAKVSKKEFSTTRNINTLEKILEKAR